MFGRLAVESGLVTYEDIVACIEEQERFRAADGTAPKLGELLVERGMLTDDEVSLILKMQANPSGLIGRQLVEKGLVSREQLRIALDEQSEYLHSGMTPPRIGEMLVDKGLVKREDLQRLLQKKETPGHLFGEFLVSNRLVRKIDVDRCLAMQKEALAAGRPVPKLGELLVSTGVLRKEQMELYSQRHTQGRRQIAPPMAVGADVGKPRKGRRSLGDYEILESLGQHVDGISFKALHNASGAVVVMHHFNTADTVVAVPVEMADADASMDDLADNSFAIKVEKAMTLRGIATQVVLADETLNSHRAVVADFIDGVTLDKVIAEHGKIEWTWAAEILHDLAGVLAQAERIGLSHDDIRPGSILVDASGKAKLALWAYTKDPVANRDWLAARHRPISFYFAPERLKDGPGPKADMFSLGLTLIQALTGSAPLRGDSAAEAVERYSSSTAMQNLVMDMDLPMELLDIIAGMVESNPANRPASFERLEENVRLFMESQGLETSVHGTVAAHDMDGGTARDIIAKYLSSDPTQDVRRQVSFLKLAKLFSGPVALMLAIMLIVTVVYKHTMSSHGLMVRANWLDQQGDKVGALSLYRMISMLYPKNETIQKRYYDLAMEVRDHGEAEVALEKLTDLHPQKRDEYLEQQGDLQVWQKRFTSAADIYGELLLARPNDLKLRAKRASALLWGHNYAEAEREYKSLSNLEPGDSGHLLGLARSAAGAKDYDVATEMFQRLFRSNELPEATLMEYGWILSDLKRTDELRDMARQALARNESVDYSLRDLTTLNYWAGDYAKAKSLLESMGGANSGDREFLLFRINLNNKLGNLDAAMADYARLAELEPNNSEHLLTIAHLHQGKGDFEKANASFQTALAREPGNVEIRREIARNYSYMNNLPEAIRWYRQIVDRNPDDKKAVDAMVQAMLWSEDYAGASRYVEQVYRARPDDRNARVNMALVYSRLGREKEALPIVDGLLKNDEINDEERERLALNAMSSNSNQLLLRIVGDRAVDSAKISRLRLMLARRLRAQSNNAAALPIYAAVLAATPEPEPGLLMEMAETAKWAQRPDIATRWLEIARDIVAEREGRRAPPSNRDRFMLTRTDWDSILEPLRAQPRIFDSLSGFQKRYGRDEAVRKGSASPGSRTSAQ